MSNSNPQQLSGAILRLLRPLVRIMLREGMSYGSFADLAKYLFVDIAKREFGLPNRKQSISRISVITGLSRKEVKRVSELLHIEDLASAEQYNRAARVIAGWRRDKNFLDAEGRPVILPLEGDGASFGELVRKFSGDIPVRALLDELLRTSAVIKLKQDRIQLIDRGFVPKGDEALKLHILGTDVGYLIATIDHNLRSDQHEPFFQRKVAYNNLPDRILPQFRRLSKDKAQSLLEELDVWLAKYDRDVNPKVKGSGRNVAGIGIYYFEEDLRE